MKWDAIDWDALERLRAAFLAGDAGGQDYWRSERDLESYDQTFAQRIAWKWDYVLNELERRGWSPSAGELLDWGCGTGIAARRFLKHFPAAPISALALWDRSPLAMQFAADEVKRVYPRLAARTGLPAGRGIGTLLVSHVLTELSDRQTDELVAIANHASAVIWVEPGTFETSRALIAVRERLRETFHVVAPCTHQAACGMLTPENERHWCHHFASPPPEVFTDGNWARFGKISGVDLRSLPLSFLVLDKRPQPSLPTGAARIIGRPRVYKAHALVLGCDASGVRERRLTKRAVPEEFRRLKKDVFDPLQVWKCSEDEIIFASDLPNSIG
jgi:SAM-dependent methyltransferase